MNQEAGEVREPWGFLLGRPPVEEYLSFRIQASGDQDVDIARAAERWRAAAAFTDQLRTTEAGEADDLSVGPLPESLVDQGSAFLTSSLARTSFATSPATLGIVELDKLVIFQRQINLRYTTELQTMVAGDWTTESLGLFKFCLTIDQPEPPIIGLQANNNTFVFSSISTDARFLGARLLDASNVGGHTPAGKATAAVVLYVGYGINALSVININGRLVLNNGSHRAYALRSAGINRAISVVQSLSRPDELVTMPVVQQNQDLYLHSPRPPMLKDYFNPDLMDVIEAPRRVRQVSLQFGMNQLDAPG